MMTPAQAALAISQSPELALLAKVTIAIVAGLMAARLAGHSRAAVRHLFVALTFAALLALPIAAAIGPVWPIAVTAPASASPAALAPSPAAPAGTPDTLSSQPSSPGGRRLAASMTWSGVLRAIWIAGAVFSIGRLLLVVWRLRRLRMTGLPRADLRALVHALAAERGIPARVEVIEHEEVPAPLTCGVRQPVIIMPADAREWAEDDLRRVLVHELEHIKRRDWPTQCLARVACALYWFHPLVWMAWRDLRLEAERACDDAVVATAESTAYAQQLVTLARRLSAARVQTVLGMANRSDLSARVNALLDERQRRGRAGVFAVAVASMAAALLVAAIAPVRAVAGVADAGETALTRSAAPQGQGRRQRALDEQLYEAAQEGDLEGVEEMLQAGANVNAAIGGDGSPLIAAARRGRADIVKYLLDRGADPNLAVSGDGSPLIAAAQRGSTDVIALLLDRGAQIDMVVPGDENPLIQAAGAGWLAALELLVQRGADVNARVVAQRYPDLRDDIRTPLGMARRGRHEAVAAFLVAAGARE